MSNDDLATSQLRTALANLNEIPLAKLTEVAGPTVRDLNRRIVHARPLPVTAFNSSL